MADLAAPPVRISEIHYDNTGTDADEAIEISGPAGTDLTGWQVVLYNGAGGASYNTVVLATTIPATCDTRGVVVVTYAVNGIQNGSPDGVALVNGSGAVVEFLSYEGVFAATNGPALGLSATDIGVSEAGTEAVGQSLQRTGGDTWGTPAAHTFGACNDDDEPPPPPPPPALPPVRLSEIHYDNTGTDADEAIEVEAPAGTNLTGWSVVLYNGTGGAAYNTQALNGAVVERCNGRGVVVVNYPVNGIQNGSPDGVALVDAGGAVVEFLSYEGVFAAADGPAVGLTSTNIGVSEAGTEPVGQSLQRDGLGVWHAPAPATFGACNENDVPPPPPPPAAPLVINELMADPRRAAGGASWGEWFEVHNTGTTPIDLQGWTIVTAGQAAHIVASAVVVPAGGFAVLGRGNDPALNGGITLDYNYFTGTATTIFLDATDWLVLRDGSGAHVDSVRWTGSNTIVKGVTRALRDASVENAAVDGANWGYSTVPFGDGDFGTPGAANGTLSDTPPAVPNSIVFSGRLATDPALPVGFQDQIFATLRDGSGTTVPSTFTWSSETPALASIDADGVITALGAGTATVRATAAEGTTGLFSLPTRVGAASGTAQYAGNAEFGEPGDGDPSDDFIVRRDQYTASFNHTRGTPNWVSYDLEATHFGPEDRCDCFTFDPALPPQFTRYTTADYTGAGTFHGYAIDRGHLARSFDRTSGSLDNATTFYFTNIIPQAADLNQGPWAVLESHLGDFARLQNREVYIVTGVAGSKGTVKDEGVIVIPASTWKVALILPRDHGLANVHSVQDVAVIAVIMPNDPGVRNVPWQAYETTVDAVEALSGYDLLALLPDQIEIALESGTSAPTPVTDGPYAASEGSAVSLSAAGSSDPDGDALAYAWDFGDGSGGFGINVSHAYAQDGEYAVRLTVTDARGLTGTAATVASVTNVAPAVTPFGGATLFPGETYTAAGSVTDPGADPWSGTADYGDGTGVSSLALNGKTFSLSHRYTAAGTFTVMVRIADDDAAGVGTAAVTVLTQGQGIQNAIALVGQLVAAGKLQRVASAALRVELEVALRLVERDRPVLAAGVLGGVLHTIDALVRSGRLSAADAAGLRALVMRVRGSLT